MMALKLIYLQYLLCTIQFGASQYNYHNNMYYQNQAQQYYQQPGQMDYGDPNVDYRRQWMRNKKPVRNTGGELALADDVDEEDSADDCSNCSCSKCDNPKPCCQQMCANSCELGDTTITPDLAYPQRRSIPGQPGPGQSVPGQSSLVFVPYPYPLIVPGIERDHSTTIAALRTETQAKEKTTTQTTTTTTTTTTPTPTTTTTTKSPTVAPKKMAEIRIGSDDEFNNLNNLILNHARKNIRPVNNRYMLTSLRRTRPTWVPKYGIVPIPDNIAEKLMSQLREVKGLNNKYRSRRKVILP